MNNCQMLIDLQNDYFPGGTMELVGLRKLPRMRSFCWINSERRSCGYSEIVEIDSA